MTTCRASTVLGAAGASYRSRASSPSLCPGQKNTAFSQIPLRWNQQGRATGRHKVGGLGGDTNPTDYRGKERVISTEGHSPADSVLDIVK